MKTNLLSRCAMMVSFLLAASMVSDAQTTYNFTNCGASGRQGPTQTQVNTTYASTNLSGQVTATNGIQYWQVPVSGNYLIEAVGAQGGGVNGGKGARMIGEFTLTGSSTLKILVGQEGEALLVNRYDYSGGGGTFVTTTTNTPLVVAGGGGGANAASTVSDGSTGTSGVNGGGGHSNANGGTGGNGGNYNNQTSDGGAGFNSNGGSGNPSPAPQSFLNGGEGGCNSWGSAACANGGFGGGGGTNRFSTSWWACGGGGGYSGGGSAYGQPSSPPYAGGGGSFNSGINQSNTPGFNLGDGYVIITLLAVPLNDGGISAFKGLDPVVCNGTHPVQVVVRNFGANQITAIDVEWEVDGVAQSPISLNTLIDTVGGSGFDTLLVALGNVQISGATTIKAWTSMPNNVADTFNTNDTLEFTVPEPLNISNIEVVDTVSCNGGSDGIARVIASGGSTPYTYAWSNNINNSTIGFVPAGTYSVIVSDNGNCMDTAQIVIPEPPAIVTNEIISPVTGAGNNGAINLSTAGGTPPYTYNWSNGAVIEDISGLTPGVYTLEITDNAMCVDTFTFNVQSIVGIADNAESAAFDIYPNPSKTGVFKLKTEGFSQNKKVEVRNMLGKLLLDLNVSTNNSVIDLSGISKGVYFLKLSDEKSEIVKRIVIE